MMNKFNILFITLLIIGCSSNNDWTVLFDGETVTGLRGYKQVGLPTFLGNCGWHIKNNPRIWC